MYSMLCVMNSVPGAWRVDMAQMSLWSLILLPVLSYPLHLISPHYHHAPTHRAPYPVTRSAGNHYPRPRYLPDSRTAASPAHPTPPTPHPPHLPRRTPKTLPAIPPRGTSQRTALAARDYTHTTLQLRLSWRAAGTTTHTLNALKRTWLPFCHAAHLTGWWNCPTPLAPLPRTAGTNDRRTFRLPLYRLTVRGAVQCHRADVTVTVTVRLHARPAAQPARHTVGVIQLTPTSGRVLPGPTRTLYIQVISCCYLGCFLAWITFPTHTRLPGCLDHTLLHLVAVYLRLHSSATQFPTTFTRPITPPHTAQLPLG